MAKQNWSPDEKQVAQIETMAGMGLTMDKIACLMGVCKKTLERAAKREERVKVAIEKGRHKTEFNVAGFLYKNAEKGNVTAQIFMLKTRFGYREVERLELTGKDGGPITVKEKLSEEEIDKRLAKYDRLLKKADQT